jgi:hypothetical protein
LILALAFIGCSNPNSSDNNAFAGTTWKQAYNGSVLSNGAVISFATSGSNVTITTYGSSVVYNYEVIDSRTARITVAGYNASYNDFVIDSSNENRATWTSSEFIRQ